MLESFEYIFILIFVLLAWQKRSRISFLVMFH